MEDKKKLSIFQHIVKQRIFVGYIAAILFIIFAKPTKITVFSGFFFCIIGEVIRTLSAGTIMKNKILTTTGPYSHVRNPLYFGSFLIGLGVCIMGNNFLVVALYIPLFLIIYREKIKNEEKKLREIFKEKLDEYIENVPRFFPRLTPWKKEKMKFELRLVKVHKEYQAWIGIYAVSIIMLLMTK